MKIGLFGGTFDPPHTGHIIVAEHAMKALGLDAVRFIPAPQPPHKQGATAASAEDRLAMIRLAIAGHPGLSVTDIEFTRDTLSFTAVTLADLHSREPETQFFLLIGMDNAVEFHLWHDPATILRFATVVALTRPGFVKDDVSPEFRDRLRYCEVPAMDVSSSEIRERVARNIPIDTNVSPQVESYIRQHKLYRST